MGCCGSRRRRQMVDSDPIDPGPNPSRPCYDGEGNVINPDAPTPSRRIKRTYSSEFRPDKGSDSE